MLNLLFVHHPDLELLLLLVLSPNKSGCGLLVPMHGCLGKETSRSLQLANLALVARQASALKMQLYSLPLQEVPHLFGPHPAQRKPVSSRREPMLKHGENGRNSSDSRNLQDAACTRIDCPCLDSERPIPPVSRSSVIQILYVAHDDEKVRK